MMFIKMSIKIYISYIFYSELSNYNRNDNLEIIYFILLQY
jgi:hypothetical protein